MDKNEMGFFRELMGKPSTSGFETQAQKVVLQYMKKHSDGAEVDVLGNVTGIVNPSGSPKIMLAGHCDEVGLIVQHINKEGYIYFQKIGGTYLPALHGQRVVIHSGKGPVRGVIGGNKNQGESAGAPKNLQVEGFWIDIGAKDRKEAEKYACIGDPVSFDTELTELKNNLYLSKGFDDKIAVFAIAMIIKRLVKEKIDASVFGVSTVQEELGTRGATTSSFRIKPHIGIAIDVIEASDYPGVDRRVKGEISLGKGPVLTRGANINPVVFDILVASAEESGIDIQRTASALPTGTDARAIQIIREGVATALISVPLRYMHTSGEIISLDDVEKIVRLVVSAVKRIKKNISLLPL